MRIITEKAVKTYADPETTISVITRVRKREKSFALQDGPETIAKNVSELIFINFAWYFIYSDYFNTKKNLFIRVTII